MLWLALEIFTGQDPLAERLQNLRPADNALQLPVDLTADSNPDIARVDTCTYVFFMFLDKTV